MNWKKLYKKLLFPPVWLMLLLTLLSAVTLTVIFIKGMQQSVPAYIA